MLGALLSESAQANESASFEVLERSASASGHVPHGIREFEATNGGCTVTTPDNALGVQVSESLRDASGAV